MTELESVKQERASFDDRIKEFQEPFWWMKPAPSFDGDKPESKEFLADHPMVQKLTVAYPQEKLMVRNTIKMLREYTGVTAGEDNSLLTWEHLKKVILSIYCVLILMLCFSRPAFIDLAVLVFGISRLQALRLPDNVCVDHKQWRLQREFRLLFLGSALAAILDVLWIYFRLYEEDWGHPHHSSILLQVHHSPPLLETLR